MSGTRVTSLRIVNDVSEADVKIIEYLAETKPAYEQAKKLVKDYDGLLKALTTKHAEGTDADTISQVPGEKHLVEIGTASNQRQIKSLARLVQILGPEVFLQICKVNIGDIEKYVPAHLLDEVLETVPTTTRKAIIIKRAA